MFYLLALYLPYVQGLFTMTKNGNFTTCTCIAAYISYGITYSYIFIYRGVARLSVMPRQAYLSIVTKYKLWEGHTCILFLKMIFVHGMASYSQLYQHVV